MIEVLFFINLVVENNLNEFKSELMKANAFTI